MHAIVLSDYGSTLAVAQRPVPEPGPGEVLIRVAAAPVNPSDLDFIDGRYGFRKPLPVVPGFEGSGTVVGAGSGLLPWLRKGKRVSFGVQQTGQGSWAQYVVVPAMKCLPLPGWLDDEQGATMLVNPLTCHALIAEAKKLGTRGIVQTAAGGVLGRMLDRFGRKEGLAVINVVRRPDAVADLKASGASHVLCSADPDFARELRALSVQLDARVALDAVGGALTGELAAALPAGGTIILYGQLSPSPVSCAPSDLIFRDIRVRGFWLSEWLTHLSVPGTLWLWEQVKGVVRGELKSEIRGRYRVQEFPQAIAEYRRSMSGGKVLLTPNP